MQIESNQNQSNRSDDRDAEIIRKMAQAVLKFATSLWNRVRGRESPLWEQVIHKIISHFRHGGAVSLFKFYIKPRYHPRRGFLMDERRVSCFPSTDSA